MVYICDAFLVVRATLLDLPDSAVFHGNQRVAQRCKQVLAQRTKLDWVQAQSGFRPRG